MVGTLNWALKEDVKEFCARETQISLAGVVDQPSKLEGIIVFDYTKEQKCRNGRVDFCQSNAEAILDFRRFLWNILLCSCNQGNDAGSVDNPVKPDQYLNKVVFMICSPGNLES